VELREGAQHFATVNIPCFPTNSLPEKACLMADGLAARPDVCNGLAKLLAVVLASAFRSLKLAGVPAQAGVDFTTSQSTQLAIFMCSTYLVGIEPLETGRGLAPACSGPSSRAGSS